MNQEANKNNLRTATEYLNLLTNALTGTGAESYYEELAQIGNLAAQRDRLAAKNDPAATRFNATLEAEVGALPVMMVDPVRSIVFTASQ